MGVTAIGLGLSALSAVAGAIQAQQASKARQQQADYQAAVQRNNAIIQRQDADAIRKRGEVLEDDRRRLVQQVKGSARAVQASQGFLVDDVEGSTNVQLLADIAEQGELDVLRIADNTELEARRREIGAINSEAQAGLFDLKSDQESPLLAGTSTLLAGASKTFGVAKSLGVFKTGKTG